MNSERRTAFTAHATQAYLTGTYTKHGRGVLTYSIYFQAEQWKFMDLTLEEGTLLEGLHSQSRATISDNLKAVTTQDLAPPDMHAVIWVTVCYASAILIIVFSLPRMGPVLSKFFSKRISFNGDKSE